MKESDLGGRTLKAMTSGTLTSRFRAALLLVALASPLAFGVPSANASVENCLYPDFNGPTIDDYRFGPSTEVPLATRVTVWVSDRPFYPTEDAFGNWITRATISVDGGQPQQMKAGEKAGYRIAQDYSIDLDINQLPPGVHDLTFVAVDECGNSDPTTVRVIVGPPGTVATCAFPFEDVC